MKIAILGGTGSFGRALAIRLRDAGEDVTVGSRDAARARETGAELGVRGEANRDAARAADLVVLAVKADAAIETARDSRDAIGEKPLLCVASELVVSRDGVRPADARRSIAERVADETAAAVTAGLHSIAARSLTGSEPPDEDALVCGDDAAAKELVLGVAAKLVQGRALDAGPLVNARVLEGLTAVIVSLNRRYRAHAGVRITGLP